MFQLFYKLIESMLGASMEHGRIKFQADRDYDGVYLVMHVSRFLEEVCKHIGSLLK